jgi:hypothetical protein
MNRPRLLVFLVAGVVLWLLAWNRVDHLRWAHQWKILTVGQYAYHIGVILMLVLFGIACLSGPTVFAFRALKKKEPNSEGSVAP